jgi:tRNA(fMet)-specific endonuclease VapC
VTQPVAQPLFVLDTSVLVHAVRRGPVWDRIRSRYRLFAVEPRPIISVVSVGELRSLAYQREWGQAKRDQLEFVLGYFRRMTIDTPAVIEAYALMDSHLQRRGRVLGKNDLWIAATTVDVGGHLLTCDRDFDDLDPAFLARTWIDPS